MTGDEVLEALRPHVSGDALGYFQMMQMEFEVTGGQLDPGRVLYTPVQCPDGRFMAVAFSLSAAEDEEGPYWETNWKSVSGPMPLAELKELANG